MNNSNPVPKFVINGRLLTILRIYVLPLPLCAAMWAVWLGWSANRSFTLYVMLLPVLYGYVMPGIATNVLLRWRFKGPLLVGNYYAHHGFMYAANMSPVLFLAFLGTPAEPISISAVVRILLCAAGLNGFVFWIHDIMLVKHGMVEIFNRPAAEGRSPEEIVTHYAPICFFLIGLTYAAGALLAFEIFVVRQVVTPTSVASVWLAGAALIFTIPSLAYRFIERNNR